LLACTPISCFSFDTEILSFGIDLALHDKKVQGCAVGLPINLQPSTSLATTVNTFTIAWNTHSPEQRSSHPINVLSS